MEVLKISFNEGNIPTEWKRQYRADMLKSDREVALNNKPETITNMTCTILEKIIRKMIQDILTGITLLQKKKYLV